jgi:hypothetical protein
MPAPRSSPDPGLARTAARLRWYLQGFAEAVPGYHGRIFTQDAAHRQAQSRRVRSAMRSIRNKGAVSGRGAERTLSRLGWYLDGLREAAPNYSGVAFATDRSARLARSARVEKELEDIKRGAVRLRPPPRGGSAPRAGRGR